MFDAEKRVHVPRTRFRDSLGSNDTPCTPKTLEEIRDAAERIVRERTKNISARELSVIAGVRRFDPGHGLAILTLRREVERAAKRAGAGAIVTQWSGALRIEHGTAEYISTKRRANLALAQVQKIARLRERAGQRFPRNDGDRVILEGLNFVVGQHYGEDTADWMASWMKTGCRLSW